MIDKAGARRADRTPGTDHPCGAGPWLPSSRRDCRRHPDSADQASVRQRSCRCSPRPPEGHAKESVTRFVRRDAPELVHRGGAPQAAIMSTSWWSSLCISFSLGFSPASWLSQRRNGCAGNCWHGNRIPCHRFYTHRWIAERRAFSPPPLERPSGTDAGNSSTNPPAEAVAIQAGDMEGESVIPAPPDTTRRPVMAFRQSLRRQRHQADDQELWARRAPSFRAGVSA